MNRADEAQEQFSQFNSIIKEICENEGGFHYKSGLKIKNLE
jgi:hypothetical protein